MKTFRVCTFLLIHLDQLDFLQFFLLPFLDVRIKISIPFVDIKHANICVFKFNWSLEHKIKCKFDPSMPHFIREGSHTSQGFL